MFTYSVYVFCSECSVPHPTGTNVRLNDELDPKRSVGDIYEGREPPELIAELTNHQVRCPKTGEFFTAKDNHQVFLVQQGRAV